MRKPSLVLRAVLADHLGVVPAAGILIARRLDQRFGPAGTTTDFRTLLPLVTAGALALLVTWADYQHAGSILDRGDEPIIIAFDIEHHS